MIVTETEAKERWCPHARVPLYAACATGEESPAAANRAAPGSSESVRAGAAEQCRCLGSGCMAWRWIAPPVPRMQTRHYSQAELVALREARTPGGYVEVRQTDLPRVAEALRHEADGLGYCGLSGAPK